MDISHHVAGATAEMREDVADGERVVNLKNADFQQRLLHLGDQILGGHGEVYGLAAFEPVHVNRLIFHGAFALVDLGRWKIDERNFHDELRPTRVYVHVFVQHQLFHVNVQKVESDHN